MNATTDRRSADGLERTLDDIGRKFSSGELIDRSVEFVRDRGPELLREARASIRANPGAVILTAAGLIWWTSAIMRSRSRRLMRRQPFSLGALAMAAGALIGAVLPMTRYENKWVGPVHDEAMARAKEASRREYDDLRQAVAASLERRANELRGARTH